MLKAASADSDSLTQIKIDGHLLDPDHTLHSGQAFRWKQTADGDWAGVLSPGGAVVRIVRLQDGSVTATLQDSSSIAGVHSYFRLGDDVSDDLDRWSSGHGDEISKAIQRFHGLRVIRQDPVECLFSFMTSAAAPIYRIRRCLDGLCRAHGAPCGTHGGEEMFLFPAVDQLADIPREEYDSFGFGFRGGNIRLAAKQIQGYGGDKWVRDLRAAAYADAKRELMTLRGIGEKIADCICLFALDKDEAVPIDVHMARIARRLFGDRVGTLASKNGYAVIADAYRDQFGEKAGWAQQYLYYAEIVGNGLWDEQLGRHRPAVREKG